MNISEKWVRDYEWCESSKAAVMHVLNIVAYSN